MLKYCLDKWNSNKGYLEAALREDESLCNCDYEYLVRLVVRHILNVGVEEYDFVTWNEGEITTIDNGEYQGTLLFVIPRYTYQPNEYEYLMTYVNYGSCSGCDTLQHIQPWDYGKLTDDEVKDFMTLCKDILTNIVKPWNNGWRHDDRFDVVTMEGANEN